MDPTSEVKTGATVRLTAEQAAAWTPRQEEIDLINRRAATGALAAAAPLPGPAREAFASGSRDFFGLTLQPVTATHVAALVKCKNKFFQSLLYGLAASQTKDGGEKKRLETDAEKLDVQPEDIFEMLWLFSLQPSAIRAIGRDGSPSRPSDSDPLGRASLQEVLRLSALALMDHFAPISADQLAGVLANHYFESFATAQSYRAPEGDRGAKKNGHSSSSPTTDSAGSSTSYAR